MVLSSYVDLPMWLIAAACCLFLYLTAMSELLLRHRKLSPLTQSLLRAPFDVIPFVLSMFVLVMGMEQVGLTARLSELMLGAGEIWRTGIGSFLAANLVNNIPMSVLFSTVVAPTGTPTIPALYAAVIGSNVGAFFTPMGALAGIMWMALLRQHGVKLSFGRFVIYGAILSVPTLLAALAGLALVI
jgi:arsenical pump membrane protein